MRAQEAWRLPAAYRYTTALDGQDLAWEFLRRNAQFREEAGGLIATTPPKQTTTIGRLPRTRSAAQGALPWMAPRDPMARWGLTFRAEHCASG